VTTVTLEYTTDPPFVSIAGWQDITSRLRRASVSRGRKGELDTFRQGTGAFIVDNRDRALEPGYAGATYTVRRNQRLRLSGDGTVVFEGYIDSVKPSWLPGAQGGDAVVELRCTDLTKLLARPKLTSPYAFEVKQDAPLHWWRCADPKGSTVMVDIGTGAGTQDGTWTDRATLGSDPIVAAAATTSALLAVADTYLPDAAGWIPAAGMPTGTAWTWEAVIARPTLDLGDAATVLLAEGSPDPAVGVVPTFRVGVVADGTTGEQKLDVDLYLPDGQLVFFNNSWTLEGTTDVVHVAVTRNGNAFKVYLNGVLLTTHTRTTSVPSWTGRARIGVGSPGAEMRVAEIAVYASDLGATRVAAHAEAATRPWRGDSTGERIERLLDFIPGTAGYRDIDPGATTDLAWPVDPLDGVRLIDHARLVELTEQGRLFVSKDGVVTFRDRRSTSGVSPVATFGDAAGEIPYAGLVEDFSDDLMANTVTVTRQGGTPRTAQDAVAVALDGGEVDYERAGVLYGSDNESLDAAANLLALYVDTHLRVEAVVLHAHRSSTVAAQCVGRDIGDVVTVKRRPPGGGSPQSLDLVIEGVAHELVATDRTWTTTFSLGPADTRTFWTLDDPVLGQLDAGNVLAF
jgi:hypothetical protein